MIYLYLIELVYKFYQQNPYWPSRCLGPMSILQVSTKHIFIEKTVYTAVFCMKIFWRADFQIVTSNGVQV